MFNPANSFDVIMATIMICLSIFGHAYIVRGDK